MGPFGSMIIRNCTKSQMRERLLQVGTALILAICIWGHVSEIFDHWDNTFRTGNDIEYSSVIVMLVAGAAIAFAYSAALVLRKASITPCRPPVFSSLTFATSRAEVFIGYSPPTPLRI